MGDFPGGMCQICLWPRHSAWTFDIATWPGVIDACTHPQTTLGLVDLHVDLAPQHKVPLHPLLRGPPCDRHGAAWGRGLGWFKRGFTGKNEFDRPCVYHAFTMCLPCLHHAFTMCLPCVYHVCTMCLPRNMLLGTWYMLPPSNPLDP